MSAKGRKAKVKVTKAVKIKEILFMVLETPSNYLKLLVEMLAKHGRTGYKISEKKRYSFKYLMSPAKVYYLFLYCASPIYSQWHCTAAWMLWM